MGEGPLEEAKVTVAQTRRRHIDEHLESLWRGDLDIFDRQWTSHLLHHRRSHGAHTIPTIRVA